MRFWLGSHHATQRWFDLEVPLFCSRRVFLHRNDKTRLRDRLPVARVPWALDSGGFTEIDKYGEWRTTPSQFVDDIARLQEEVGHLAWVAPQDWMCEPKMLRKTGLSIYEHQERTVGNFRLLRQLVGELVIPVLQGWELDDYLACWDEYSEQGVDLEQEPLVGLGTVCRRQDMAIAGIIVRRLAAEGLPLHGFGIKMTGIQLFGDQLASSDSMAWSLDGRKIRKRQPCPEGKSSCSNCVHHALAWRRKVMADVGNSIGQLQLEVAT